MQVEGKKVSECSLCLSLSSSSLLVNEWRVTVALMPRSETGP